MLPAIPVIISVLAFNFMGDGLRDARRSLRPQVVEADAAYRRSAIRTYLAS